MAVNKIGGVSTIGGGNYDELVINGVITCNGDLTATSANIDGVVTVNGMVEAKEGIELGGVLTVTGKVKGKDIRVDGVCTIRDNVEADHVFCKGVITVQEQISADLVEGKGLLSAKEIVGEKINVHCDTKKRHVFFKKSHELCKIGMIEATEIDIDGIQAKTVNGHNVTIGSDCIVENVDCSGTLSIAEGAEVKNVNGQPR